MISTLDLLEVPAIILVPSESIPDSTFGDLNHWFVRQNIGELQVVWNVRA